MIIVGAGGHQNHRQEHSRRLQSREGLPRGADYENALSSAHHQVVPAEAARDTCNVYGKGVIGERAAQKLFAKFKNGDLDLEDTLRSERPSELYEKHMKALLKEDGRQTNPELAEKMKCVNCAVTISNHLQSIGFSQNLGAWVPHEFNETNKKIAF
ncbi:hypothetical protein LAZ67_20001769 [Cordylochernes scorpioides]|uniref:Mos1 transposase HTH domain-containing protein n=1 Tax=Cordylochernes scorpioides TaxID=51811 RepID=A0ABY6LKB2_9ARAC|nr:hypothetical protein LAZ67_20001769 [Cordylochernes scorpioides]